MSPADRNMLLWLVPVMVLVPLWQLSVSYRAASGSGRVFLLGDEVGDRVLVTFAIIAWPITIVIVPIVLLAWFAHNRTVALADYQKRRRERIQAEMLRAAQEVVGRTQAAVDAMGMGPMRTPAPRCSHCGQPLPDRR